MLGQKRKGSYRGKKYRVLGQQHLGGRFGFIGLGGSGGGALFADGRAVVRASLVLFVVGGMRAGALHNADKRLVALLVDLARGLAHILLWRNLQWWLYVRAVCV